MPRRRRPRCKLNQSMVVRKKNPESSGPSGRPKPETTQRSALVAPPPIADPPNEEPPCESPQSEEPQSEEPLSEEPVSEEPPEVESTSSADPPSDDGTDYRLFPEIYDRQPVLPTFADIFGQPLYRAGFELEEAPSTSAAPTPSTGNPKPGGGCSAASCETNNVNSGGGSSGPGKRSHENEMGIQSSPDGRFTNIPSTMLGDRFGMTGLLAAMRATQTDPSSTQLVFGEDLTTFGLDLAARGDIYVHFNGPFTHSPPERSSMDCALEMGMRAMRDAMVMYPTMAPVWDPFQPETGHLGLVGGGGKDGSKESVPETGPPAEVPTPEPVVAAPVRERGRERHR
ncbi:hypothetical protein KR026_000767, partial [Drosophila bipectinata]